MEYYGGLVISRGGVLSDRDVALICLVWCIIGV